MYLNHQRLSVPDWNALPPESRPASFCPECNRPLIAKRGNLVVWHWAHQKNQDRPCAYGAGETEWHRRWKAAFAMSGFSVEYPYIAKCESHQGKVYRFDACRVGEEPEKPVLAVWEFVHSLSDEYAAKDAGITSDKIELFWVLDGEKFVSSMSKKHHLITDGYFTGSHTSFLKAKAFDLYKSLQGEVYTHWDNQLWTHVGHNMWHRTPPPTLDRLFRGWNYWLEKTLLCGLPLESSPPSPG
jgi:hypothetical protein